MMRHVKKIIYDLGDCRKSSTFSSLEAAASNEQFKLGVGQPLVTIYSAYNNGGAQMEVYMPIIN